MLAHLSGDTWNGQVAPQQVKLDPWHKALHGGSLRARLADLGAGPPSVADERKHVCEEGECALEARLHSPPPSPPVSLARFIPQFLSFSRACVGRRCCVSWVLARRLGETVVIFCSATLATYRCH